MENAARPDGIRLYQSAHSDAFAGTGDMNPRNDMTISFEQWLELLRSSCVRYHPYRHEERLFVGRVRPFMLGGLEGTDVGCNVSEVHISPHSDRLFQRVRRIVEGRFTDHNVGPAEVAAEAGISLRYLQKLFTRRGITCGQYIQSLRLGHAFTLLTRRGEVEGGQSISEIAWASGYRDVSYFHRVFRRRFGHSPGRHHIADASRHSSLVLPGSNH
jgi:AraC-like DNA-binding protein